MKLCRVMLVALVVAPPCLAQRPLDCSALQNGTRMDEKATLATAPHGAARLSPHRLDVRWAHGVRSFVDVPPYGVGEEAGGRNFYCGYDPVTAMHLIYHYDEDGVDGLLLDDSTGAVLPAGYSVLYAPDHSRYLAIVQPEGWDGQEWRIYLADGRLEAEGRSEPCDEHFNCLEMLHPWWTDRGKLVAEVTCWSGNRPTHTVPVRLIAELGWLWSPADPCKQR